jgi:hypothetical protein
MNLKMLKATIAGLVLSLSGIANAGVILTEVADNAYITVDGYDIAWAGPCAVAQSSCGPLDFSHQAQFGWEAMSSSLFAQLNITAFDFVFEGANVDALTGNNLDEASGATVAQNPFIGDIAVAAPWFASAHKHIDWSNGVNGQWSFSDMNNSSYFDSLAVRVSTTDIPEPSTLAIFGLALIGFAASRCKK